MRSTGKQRSSCASEARPNESKSENRKSSGPPCKREKRLRDELELNRKLIADQKEQAEAAKAKPASARDAPNPGSTATPARRFDYLAEPKQLIEICPACGAGRAYHRTLSVIDRYTLPARFDYCRKCAFVFANPRLTPKAYARFYQDGHYRRMVTECTGADQSIESINQSQRFYATWIGHQFGDQIGIGLSGGGRLLDAGGGTGVFAKTLVEAFGGASGTVVDPAEAEVMHAQRLGLRAIPASVEDWEPDGQYEVTAIVQTIDHLLDPLPVLRKLRQVTSRLLLIDIVDFPRLWSAHWQRFAHGAGALKIDHPSNFHPAGIEALLARSGFRVLKKAPRPGKAAVALAAEPVAEVYQDARPGTGHVHGIIRGCFESHTWLGRYHMQPQ